MLTITPIDGEPRILDTVLATHLGMAEPRKIRQNLIEPNREELEAYGPLRMDRIQTGGRPGTAFYLNRQQALLICILSKTEKAKEVRAEVIRHSRNLEGGSALPSVTGGTMSDVDTPKEAAGSVPPGRPLGEATKLEEQPDLGPTGPASADGE